MVQLKKYGTHKYGNDGMGDCEYGCGCKMHRFDSCGPAGIDPFEPGLCPKNPLDGKSLGGDQDRDEVIRQRVGALENKARVAENKYKGVSPGAKKLARTVESLRRQLRTVNDMLSLVKKALASPRRKKR